MSSFLFSLEKFPLKSFGLDLSTQSFLSPVDLCTVFLIELRSPKKSMIYARKEMLGASRFFFLAGTRKTLAKVLSLDSFLKRTLKSIFLKATRKKI